MKRSIAKQAGPMVSLTVLLLCMGCGGERKYPVRGHVTFQDGSPLTKGYVFFSSADGRGGYGRVAADGGFEVMFDEPGDGLPAGNYRVYLRPPDPTEVTPEEAAAAPGRNWGIPEKYFSAETSGLTASVSGAIEDIKISIEKDPRRDHGYQAAAQVIERAAAQGQAENPGGER